MKKKTYNNQFKRFLVLYISFRLFLYLFSLSSSNNLTPPIPAPITVFQYYLTNPTFTILREHMIIRLFIEAIITYIYLIIGVRLGFRKKDKYEKQFEDTKSTIFIESKNITVIDTETTGLGNNSKLIEFAAVRFRNSKPVKKYNILVNPGTKIPAAATKVNGITDKMVAPFPTIAKASPKIYSFIGNNILVGHNVKFNINVLNRRLTNGINNQYVDSLHIFRHPLDLENYKLGTIKKHFKIKLPQTHRALDDVIQTYQGLIKLNKPHEIWIRK
jgi:DNA polymerase III alpha subunit (gram-positive type)